VTQENLSFDDTRKSQYSRILNYLLAGNKLTPLESLRLFGCFRLGARIWEAKKAGYKVNKRMVETSSGAHVAEYWIDEQ